MLTLNQIVAKLTELRESHDQLNSFYFGHPYEFEPDDIIYPLMGVHINPGALGLRTHQDKYTLYFADRVATDESNETHVLSDMRRVAMGIFAQFNEYLNDNGAKLLAEAELAPFWEKWDSSVCGWQLDFTLQQFYDKDSCQEPSDFVSSLTETGAVRIYNSVTGATVATRNPGQEYPVLVFSGIHGGTPSTTYTNSIVGGTP